jgi:hypothetical protein
MNTPFPSPKFRRKTHSKTNPNPPHPTLPADAEQLCADNTARAGVDLRGFLQNGYTGCAEREFSGGEK